MRNVLSVKKQHNHFPQRKLWRAKKASELVHFNLCGPLHPPSNGVKRFFITFIDDFSQKTYIQQEKSEAFATFKASKVIVEKEIGSPIKILHTDHSGE